MLIIPCPHCGDRAEVEFRCGGEAGIVRPPDGDSLDDAGWADYLFMRTNARGSQRELWCHAAGCRRWFTLVRDTVTYRLSPDEPQSR
ncbi:MAG: sarcosine oxidase subunit delta [Burkholderiaceae bacterium]